MQQGWIRLYRSMLDNDLWRERRVFSRAEAWLDLLLTTNFADRKVMIAGQRITVKAGQNLNTTKYWADHWGWSRGKVKKFLNDLKEDQTIGYETTSKYTLVTILKWGFYQNQETSEQHQTNNKKTSEQHQTDTTKEGKELKNVKNDIDPVIVVSAGEKQQQAMSLEVGAAKAADNRPTHSQQLIYCDEIPTTAAELQKAQTLITSLFQQYRKNPIPSENDVKKAFKRVYRREELPSGEAIGVYDAHKADLLAVAFELAADGSNGGTPWNYIAGIYNNWEKNGIDSLETLEQHEYERNREKKERILNNFYGE